MEQIVTIGLAFVIVTVIAVVFNMGAESSKTSLFWISLVNLGLILGIGTLMFWLQGMGQYTYNQFYSGTETGVEQVRYICAQTGGCEHTYTRSEQYSCPKTVSHTDSKGNTTYTTENDTCTRYYYDDLFYEEDSWIIHTTVGDQTVGDHVVPVNWQPGIAYTQYNEVSVSDLRYAAQQAGIGEPREAVLAQQAINAGYPRAASAIGSYDNPINGSGNKTATSDQVGHYKSLGVLPNINKTVFDYDQSNKVIFAGFTPPASVYQRYQRDAGLLNEESGSLKPVTKRFDIELVVVNDTKVPESQSISYTNALNAYWQDQSTFGHWTLPKNMAVFVMGTNGQRITWAFGFTLIDTDNNQLWQLLRVHVPDESVANGVGVNPDLLLGTPHAQVANNQLIRVVPSHGVLEQLIFDPTYGFSRSHITSNHAGTLGYDWMKSGPPFWYCLIVFVVALLVSGVVTLILTALAAPIKRDGRSSYSY